MRQAIGLRHRAFPQGARFHGVGQMCDWLELLDLEVVEVRRYGIGFPWLESRSDGDPFDIGSFTHPLAEAYLLVAKKRVIPINRIGRVQRAQIKPLIGVPASEARSNAANFENDQA
jgi:hypothetical protein